MANIGDMLGKALSIGAPALGAAVAGPIGAALPLIGSAAGNILSGINQRAARKWEEDMYNQYNSPSALVRQYQEAGINPSLMFGGQTPSAPTDTSAAPVMESNTGSVTEMLAQLIQLDMLDSEKRIKRASADKLETENQREKFELGIRQKFADLESRYSIAQIIAGINKLEEETALTKYQRETLGPLDAALKKAAARRDNAASAIDEWRKSVIDRDDRDPNGPWRTQLVNMLIPALEKILAGDTNGAKEIIKNLADTPLPGGKDSPVNVPDYGVK